MYSNRSEDWGKTYKEELEKFEVVRSNYVEAKIKFLNQRKRVQYVGKKYNKFKRRGF